MKKLNFVLCFIFILFLFSGCTNTKNLDTSANNIDSLVAGQICNISGYKDFNDETIKALSVVIRTNILNNQNNENLSYQNIDEHIMELTNQTKDEILSEINEEIIIQTDKSEKDEIWQTTIKKSNLLEFLSENNISLTNISNIEPIFDENDNLTNISVGGKTLSFEKLKQFFNLKSQKIISVENNLTSITITGKYPENKETFIILDVQKQANLGKDYKQLLNYFFSGYKLKTNAKI